MLELLSERGRSNVKDMPALVQAHFSTLNDMYDSQQNPNGHINMGTAETRLVDKEVIELLEKTQARMKLIPKNIHYDLFHGSIEFRTAIANHWQNIIFGKDSERRLSPDNIVACAGCSVALEMLATMICDPGDVVLIPAPYYSGFVDDINARAEVVPVGVHCGTDLEKSHFESALAEQTKNGKRVRAVLFSSPNNPVGTVYSKEAINHVIEFCMENDLDIISDEIYAQTVHDPNAKWVSTLKLVPKEYMHRVHVTSSFAKDFALSGFRTGFAISFNPDLLKGMQTITYYSAVSTHTQALLTALMKAPELPSVMKTSRERMHVAYKLMEKGLNDMGVKTLPAQAGIFIFGDFSSYLEEPEFAKEHVLWEKIFGTLKVNISPGQFFDAPTPGWFRACYAQEPAVVEEACKRLSTLQNNT
jgi:aspartate/methionine/tyrosine aminotransferase